MAGPPGTGKTHAAVAELRERMIFGGGRWVFLPDWIAACRSADDPQEAEDLFGRTANIRGLLVIDDLAPRKQETEFALELVDRLVDRRYRHGSPTIITTNLPPAEIIARLGERVLDRLRAGQWIEWSGTSSKRKPLGAER